MERSRVAHTDVVGITISLLIICFGLLVASIMLATFGVEIAGVDQPPEEETADWMWWLTDAPTLYPSAYLTGAFLLLLFVFRVYMKLG